MRTAEMVGVQVRISTRWLACASGISLFCKEVVICARALDACTRATDFKIAQMMGLMMCFAATDDSFGVDFDPGRGNRGWPRAGQVAPKNGFSGRKRQVLSTSESRNQ